MGSGCLRRCCTSVDNRARTLCVYVCVLVMVDGGAGCGLTRVLVREAWIVDPHRCVDRVRAQKCIADITYACIYFVLNNTPLKYCADKFMVESR